MSEERIPEHALAFVDQMIAAADAEQAAKPHVALIFDPHLKDYQALGPFEDRDTAMRYATEEAFKINQGFRPEDPPVIPRVALFHDVRSA